jgi:hypothetical protein
MGESVSTTACCELDLTLSQVIYNEGWGQSLDGYPEFGLTSMVKSLDPTRLVNSVTGWHDHGAGDYHVCPCPRYASTRLLTGRLGQSSLRISSVRHALVLTRLDSL